MTEVDDATLLDAVAKQRDQGAYAQLFDRYENVAYSLALHITGNHHAAEEAVQEAMLRVWVFAHQFEPGSVRAWILQIVSRESLRVCAKRKASKETTGVDMQEPANPGDTAPEPQGNTELAGALRKALEKLHSADRQLVALHYGGGMSHQEIAAQLGMPRRTVSYKIQEALKRLRTGLTQAGFAAAVPLLAPEQLGQLLSSGSVAPTLLRARTLEQVAQGKIQLAQTTHTAGKAGKAAKAAKVAAHAGGMKVAGAVLASVVLAGAGWQMMKPAKAPTVPVSTPAPIAPPETKVVPPAPLAPLLPRVTAFDANPKSGERYVCNFTEGDVRGIWKVMGDSPACPGNWSLKDGTLGDNSNDSADDHRLGAAVWCDTWQWQDAKISVQFKTDDDDGVGLRLRVRGPKDFLQVMLTKQDEERRIERFDGKNWTELASQKTPAAYEPGRWHTLEVIAREKSIEAKLNGTSILKGEDAQPAAGIIALVNAGNSSLSFRNFSIEALK